jgi:hypothetical protein
MSQTRTRSKTAKVSATAPIKSTSSTSRRSTSSKKRETHRLAIDAWHTNYYPEEPLHFLDGVDNLFQVNFKDEEQFTTFPGLFPGNKSASDCAVGSTTVLRLRSALRSLRDANFCNINEFGLPNQLSDRYFSEIVGRNITTKYAVTRGDQTFDAKKIIKNKLKDKLRSGYVTFVYLNMIDDDENVYAHAIVAYKVKNKLFFFDPQPRENERPLPPTTNLSELVEEKYTLRNIGWKEIIDDEVKDRKRSPEVALIPLEEGEIGGDGWTKKHQFTRKKRKYVKN